jgi:hypothetical protein
MNHEFLCACFAAGDDPALINAATTAAFKAHEPVRSAR